MKLQGLWGNVTIVQASEFGRTLTVMRCFGRMSADAVVSTCWPPNMLRTLIRSTAFPRQVHTVSLPLVSPNWMKLPPPQVNGLGTDHAWGGNTFLAGGSVKGARVHGHFPSDLSEAGEEVIGRGRLVPTTSWEALWNAVAVG